MADVLDEPAALYDARGFPITLAGLNQDDRVSFSRVSQKYTLEQEDGTEYEFDEILKRWYEVVSLPNPRLSRFRPIPMKSWLMSLSFPPVP